MPINPNGANAMDYALHSPSGGVGFVTVVTGNEDRPAGGRVFWFGGASKPTNMGVTDLWFRSGGGGSGDLSAPSVPTGLSASNISGTGFTLNWTASTDNTAVTAYDVYLGGVLKTSTATNSASITGLTISTAYSVTVRARDAASNASAQSAALTVTTTASAGTPQHSIWGATYPYTTTKYTDTPLTVANSFYTYGTNPDVSAWRVRGARIWIPAGVTVSQSATVSAWHGAGTATDLATAANTSATISSWVSGAWNQVIFPTPIETNSGEMVWIGYRFGNGDYFAAPKTEIGDSFVTASDGSKIALSAEVDGRSKYRYDGGSTQGGMNAPGYAIDVIYDEGP